MLVGEILTGNARRRPHRPAWSFAGETWSWQQANARVNRAANALRASGLGPQDRVAVMSGNSHRLAELYFALAKANLVAVPVNPHSVAREIDFVLAEVGARGLMISAALAPRLDGVTADLSGLACVAGMGDGHGLARDYEDMLAAAPADEPASDFDDTALRAIKFTSGTTGAPKGVTSTHRQYMFSVTNYLLQFPYVDDDRCLLMLPMTAGVGIQMLVAYAYRGCPTAILPRFDAGTVLDTIAAERVTRMYAVPTTIAALTDEQAARPRDLSSVRLIEYGGAPAPIALMRRAAEVLGVPLSQDYGSSETGGLIAFLSPEDHDRLARGADADSRGSEPLSFGREAQGYHIRLVDDHGDEVGDGEVGEIVVQGDPVTSGYWNRPDLTTEVLRDGWLYTGDMARRDGDGLLTIVDRKRDVIITGGINVYSAEIEAVLSEHPAVQEAAVIGEADERWGEAVTACIVLRRGSGDGEAELRRFCDDNLAGHKRPKRFRFFATLPKTSSGKVRKVELRGEPRQADREDRGE